MHGRGVLLNHIFPFYTVKQITAADLTRRDPCNDDEPREGLRYAVAESSQFCEHASTALDNLSRLAEGKLKEHLLAMSKLMLQHSGTLAIALRQDAMKGFNPMTYFDK